MEARLAIAICAVALLAGCGGRQAEVKAPAAAPAAAPMVDLRVTPNEIAPGESAVLSWTAPAGTRVLIQEGNESRGPGQPIAWRDLSRGTGPGQLRVTPQESTWYVLTCEGGDAPYCVSTTVHVVTRAAPR